MTCLREAPSVRRVANSRARWATVIDRVLKITNDPTNRAIAANASRKYWKKRRNSSTSPASCAAWSAAFLTCAERGSIGATSRTRRSGETPLRAARGRAALARGERDRVELAGLASEPLRDRHREHRDRRPAERVDLAVASDA